MLQLNSIGKLFSDKKLFENVNMKFHGDNTYGVIGANGAGKSTLLKIITGDMKPSTGHVSLEKDKRMGILRQDHNAYDDKTVMDTVLLGYKELFDLQDEMNRLYAKEDATDEDYMKAADLGAQFEEKGGYEAEADATKLITGLGLSESVMHKNMADLRSNEKVKVLLAQALFGNPDILVMDEPTNHLDLKAITWLEKFVIDFPNTVIVVSHDSEFLNKVCTHMVDIDFGEAKLFPGNYDFWKQSSQLALEMRSRSNDKKENQIKELQAFISRFGANASKAKQATSRKKLLDKITLEDIKPSTRKYPFIDFPICREPGKDILEVKDLKCVFEGETLFENISFRLKANDKVALIGSNDIAKTKLLEILIGKEKNFEGEFKWGQTITPDIFENNNDKYFKKSDMDMVKWLQQYDTDDRTETEIRSFLGRMLFKGDSALKKVNVCSGGEKVRLMFSKLMLTKSNALLFDQPLDHLDMESIESVIDSLVRYKGTLVYATYNKTLIGKTATMIIDFDKDKDQVFRGTLAEYLG